MKRIAKTINRKGYTLSELLVTIAIMSFVAVGAIGGIVMFSRMHDKFEQKRNAQLLLTLTQHTLSNSLNREEGVVLALENTDTKYHISYNGVPLECAIDVSLEDGTYITIDNYSYEPANKTYEYDLVVIDENNNEIIRQHIVVHVSAI